MTRPLAIALTGVGGRMGAALLSAVREDDTVTLAAAVERPGHPIIGRVVDGITVVDELAGALSQAAVDAVVDFSALSALLPNAELSAEAGAAFVSGTTGLTSEHHARLDVLAERIPLLWAPNMSVGINLLLRLVREAAQVLGLAFDPEVVEMHHRHKVDAPSGTAARIVDVLREVRATQIDEPRIIYGRQGQTGARDPREIAVHAMRGGGVVGDHTVVFASPAERVELTHRAQSRATFAEGALRAARFLHGRSPGRYTMDDVLGFDEHAEEPSAGE